MTFFYRVKRAKQVAQNSARLTRTRLPSKMKTRLSSFSNEFEPSRVKFRATRLTREFRVLIPTLPMATWLVATKCTRQPTDPEWCEPPWPRGLFRSFHQRGATSISRSIVLSGNRGHEITIMPRVFIPSHFCRYLFGKPPEPNSTQPPTQPL